MVCREQLQLQHFGAEAQSGALLQQINLVKNGF